MFHIKALLLVLSLILIGCGKADFSSTNNSDSTANSLSSGTDSLDDNNDEALGDRIISNNEDAGDGEINVEDIGFVTKASCGKSHQDHKVLVCHYPSGNVDNAHEICISEKALKAHIATHGNSEDVDHLGSCENSP